MCRELFKCTDVDTYTSESVHCVCYCATWNKAAMKTECDTNYEIPRRWFVCM